MSGLRSHRSSSPLCVPPGVAMVMPAEDSKVRVVVRVRPPTPRELESQRRPVVQMVDERVLVFDPEEPDGGFLGLKWGSAHDGPKKKGKDLTFVFDRVFGEAATQQDVFQHTTHSVLDSFLQGYNCSGESRAGGGGWGAPLVAPCLPASFRGLHASRDCALLPPSRAPVEEGAGPFVSCVGRTPRALAAGPTHVVPVLLMLVF